MNPQITYLADTYRFSYPDEEIQVLLERFSESSRDGLIAEATIMTSRAPKPGLLHHGRLNLSSTRSQAEVIGALTKRDKEGFLADVDLGAIIQQVCFFALKRWREGEPSIILADAPLEPTRYMLYPLVQYKAINMIYGDGGVSKSLLGLGMGISVATGHPILGFKPHVTGPVLYLDWEDEASTHRERMNAICDGAGIELPRNLYYRRLSASLDTSVATLRKEVAVKGIVFVIVDSVGIAGGDEPERASTKISLFGAARTLMTTLLAIDHVPKLTPGKPFGSVYTRNTVRLAWEVQKAQGEGDSSVTVSLRNDKINRGMLHKRQGYRITYHNEADSTEEGDPISRLVAVNFTSVDLKLTDLVKTLDTIDQVTAFLAENGPSTVKDIKEATELKDATIRSALKRWKDKKVKKALSEDSWSLVTSE